MQTTTNGHFDALVALIKDVKPGLADSVIQPDHSVVEDLGLDSLDILQLSRRINRTLDPEFDLDTWNEGAPEHRRSVRSLLDTIEPAVAQ
jgi:acyl carrier protein